MARPLRPVWVTISKVALRKQAAEGASAEVWRRLPLLPAAAFLTLPRALQFKNELASSQIRVAEQLETSAELKAASERSHATMLEVTRAFIVTTQAAQQQKHARSFTVTSLVSANASIAQLDKELALAATQVRWCCWSAAAA